MAFTWNKEVRQDLDDLLIVLEDEVPQTRQSNNLTLTLTINGKVAFESEAPDEVPFPDQAAMVIAAFVAGGQTEDLKALIHTLIDHTTALEGMEVLLKAIMMNASFMEHIITLQQAVSGGAFHAPHFSVSNFPPPNRPKIERDSDEEEESDGSEDARSSADPAGPTPGGE